jgi:hypothetical protein
MTSIQQITLSLLITCALTTLTNAQELDDAAIVRASMETLLSMPEPPLGYAVTKHPLIGGDQLLGFQVQVMKEDAVSKVLIKVETRDLSDRGFRVAACKGYVNGFASGLKDAGFKITAHKVPDIEKSDFKTPVVVDLTFANDEGTTILVNKRMFFTTKGFDITVLATDENDLKLLTDWAAQIGPVSPGTTR